MSSGLDTVEVTDIIEITHSTSWEHRPDRPRGAEKGTEEGRSRARRYVLREK